MVSNASDDLPDPDSPVKTISLSRGMDRVTFLRLCSRAPRMVIWSVGIRTFVNPFLSLDRNFSPAVGAQPPLRRSDPALADAGRPPAWTPPPVAGRGLTPAGG